MDLIIIPCTLKADEVILQLSSRIRNIHFTLSLANQRTMNKSGPPPSAPPSYAESVGGVPPSSPFVQPGQTIIVTTLVPPGPGPTHMVCPHCHAEIDTSIRSEPSLLAWISGGILALMGCWFGCCLIPCCIPSCMNIVHSCPNCKAHLGTFNSL